MISNWWEIYKPGLIDIFDIIIVTVVIYNLFIILQKTKASSMIFGLIIIVIFSIISNLFQLNALNWIISSIQTIWLISFVILFQPELRRALANLGSNKFFSLLSKNERTEAIDEVVDAVVKMSEQKIGALIVFTGNTAFKDVLETGVDLMSDVNSKLIQTIFYPHTPLHDGAVIIRDNYIIGASCILPLTEMYKIGGVLGTRHRAALGITEHTDAVSIVVSEETGTISIAHNAVLSRNLNAESLRKKLLEFLDIKTVKNKNAGKSGNEKKDLWTSLTTMFKHN